MSKPRAILCILDGWGIAPTGAGNAITLANPPVYNQLFSTSPHTQLEASGIGVGLPPDTDGNSETGHLNIGAGRIVPQDLTRINLDIASGNFFNHEELAKTVDHVKDRNSALHLMGLISANAVHAFNDHLFALLIFAARHNLPKVYLHLFTDGRDSPPKDAINQIKAVEENIARYHVGQIASLSGRYYSMDRDQKLDRTQKAFDSLVGHPSPNFATAMDCVQSSYDQNITDEFIVPCSIGANYSESRIKPNDAVVLFNFRNDRPRQITKMLLDSKIENLRIVTMTRYSKDYNCPFLYETIKIPSTLGETLFVNHLSQLRASESEKERVMNYYFDGQHEDNFPLCDKLVVPSPKVATYDMQPGMSTENLIEEFCKKYLEKDYSVGALNIACPDMLGHTGKIDAAKIAIETTDHALAQLKDLADKTNSYLVVTADHGNVEEMLTSKGEVDTKHSISPVPLIIYHPSDQSFILQKGVLGDVAPTILHLIEVKIPEEMTGRNLVVR